MYDDEIKALVFNDHVYMRIENFEVHYFMNPDEFDEAYSMPTPHEADVVYCIVERNDYIEFKNALAIAHKIVSKVEV